MLRFIAMPSLVLVILTGCTAGLASRSYPSGWSAVHASDPVTGQTRCVVANYDYAGGTKFTRTGFLYPVVERNSEYGLLVGVSSGGSVRLPVGDILWRVDGNPYHRISASGSPLDEQGKELMDRSRGPNLNEQQAAAMEQTMRTIAGSISASTLASGPQARALVDEMLHGRSLIFREASADPGLGLPTGQAQAVGIIRGGQQVPIPLDASFKQALRDCGIG